MYAKQEIYINITAVIKLRLAYFGHIIEYGVAKKECLKRSSWKRGKYYMTDIVNSKTQTKLTIQSVIRLAKMKCRSRYGKVKSENI